MSQLISQQCPLPSQTRPFILFAIDSTPLPRRFTKKLSERTIVYQPNPSPGNKPIVVGHQYSLVGFLPEKTNDSPPWILPLSIQRVPSEEKSAVFGIQQLNQLIEDPTLDFKLQICVATGDSAYSSIESRKEAIKNDNFILVARVSGNRNVYHQPEAPTNEFKRPKWFGEKMNLGKEDTHTEPDDIEQIEFISKKGHKLTVTVSVWNDMLFRGKKGFASHKHPFTLIRAEVTDEQGQKVFKRPIWIMTQGKKRKELTASMIYESYRQRYDIEHFFRFGKQRLLMDKYQTPETAHEENWWTLSMLAYVQLYLIKDIADKLPMPWERYLEKYTNPDTIATPSQVQRDFTRLIKEIGTPSQPPKKRGISPGRSKGDEQEKREDNPVIYKTEKKTKTKDNAKSKAKKQVTVGFEKQPVILKPASYEDILMTLKRLLPKIDMSLKDFLHKTADGLTG